jgi:homoserine kinase
MPTPKPWVEAFAPATLSNIGPGFDCLGIALDEPGDRVRARRRDDPGVLLSAVAGDDGRLPTDATENTAGVAVRRLLDLVAPDSGVELQLTKGLPLGSGLGSSAASACAALVATVEVLQLEVSLETLIECAREGEAKACGAAHPDNVAPSLAGGIVLISATDPLRIQRLPVPESLYFAVYTPGCEVKTADARAVLPERVPVPVMVRQSARLAALVHALHRGDLNALGEAIVDEVAEPARAGLIPGFLDAKTTCIEAGALACTISGAGPTTMAVTSDRSRATALLEILDDTFTVSGVGGTGRVARVGEGARLLSERLH